MADRAYCVKCKKKVTPKGAKIGKVGKRRALKGKCPKCGTKVTAFLPDAKKGRGKK